MSFEISRSKVEEMLWAAVTAAYSNERIIFAERAHERSIVFHIARRLAAEVDDRMHGWSVDVEYDRWHSDDLEGVKKRMWRAVAGTGSQVALQSTTYEDRDVYPDIIVHKRTGLSAGHDLLVVEVKKEETRGHEEDRARLRAFLDSPFNYRHAAFLTLPADGGLPRLEWITPESV